MTIVRYFYRLPSRSLQTVQNLHSCKLASLQGFPQRLGISRSFQKNAIVQKNRSMLSGIIVRETDYNLQQLKLTMEGHVQYTRVTTRSFTRDDGVLVLWHPLLIIVTQLISYVRLNKIMTITRAIKIVATTENKLSVITCKITGMYVHIIRV